MLAKLYRKIVPVNLRNILYKWFVGRLVFFLRNFKIIMAGKLIYLTRFLWPDNDKFNSLAFIGKYGLSSYPGEYALLYRNFPVEVFFDNERALNFVVHNGRQLYFTSKLDVPTIKKLYTSLVIEQDPESPHKYIDDETLLQDKILLDIGSAEGIFTLDNIEHIKKAYIFESEDFWIDALKATFEPWKEKVEIVQKYIGKDNNENTITIDSFLVDKEKSNFFFKMDIEGAEYEALMGAKNTLSNCDNILASICTYHHERDPDRINAFMSELGFSTTFTKGYLYWGKRLNKAILRCKK